MSPEAFPGTQTHSALLSDFPSRRACPRPKLKWIAGVALFCAGIALADDPSPLTRIEISPLDEDAIAYGTFQSHNQKVVSTPEGIFATHIRKSNTNYTAQQWRLSRSLDGGKTFSTLFEGTHATSAPALEADQAGNLYFCRADFLDGNAYLYRLDASRLRAQPQVSKLPGGAAGKYCLLLDEPRRQLYWFAHNNTFHVAGLDGTVRSNFTLLAAGKSAVLQYPHLTLGDGGVLFAGWTTSMPTGYLYRSAHAIKSPVGGQSWQSLDGRRLDLPIPADDSGPSTQISKPSEFDVHTWLSAFMAKDDKLHVVYWAETKPQRQWYVRYDQATGKREIETENIFSGRRQEKVNDSGAFAARRSGKAGTTLYFVSTVDDRRRLACLASDDNGETWYEYAVCDKVSLFRTYSIGTARELTRDGMILGTFTDVVENAKNYYEDHSGQVYFFRIQAGLCRVAVQRFSHRDGRLRLVLSEVRGQPEQIRLGFADGSWSDWHPFATRPGATISTEPSTTQELDLPAGREPHQIQLRSGLGVLSPPQNLVNPAAAGQQVLAAKPVDMMLNYFREQARPLPKNHVASASLEQWEKRRVELRRQLWHSMGSFPLEHRPPLNARITGRVDHGDHVVEKILYESMPGLYVTALAYVPKNLQGRAPAVICVNGHWPGAKTQDLIQRRCICLARMGVIAFCQDVIGTGERQAYDGAAPQWYHGFFRGATPWIVDRSLLGYVMYECMRAFDYVSARDDVDPKRIMCTGASGGGKQSMFFAALDDRLAGAVPVCYISSYQAHMGATACVGEMPVNILRYANQWEILGLHAPRPLLCIGASRDVPVFLPKEMYATLERTKEIYRLYGAADQVHGAEVDAPHDYNREMRQILYRHVAEHLLGNKDAAMVEPDDLPVETPETLRVGLPANSETMRSLTFARAKELVSQYQVPDSLPAWQEQRENILSPLKNEIFGGFPDPAQCKRTLLRKLSYHGYPAEHWTLEPEPGVIVPAVLLMPRGTSETTKRPAVVVVDEDGKSSAFERGAVDTLLSSGRIVLAIDCRGLGETAGTVPSIEYGPGTPEYNLSNYGILIGRPVISMWAFDVRCAADLLASRPEADAARISIAGRGRGALAALLAAAYDDRIHSVATEEMLATWVFNEEFRDIGLAYFIPRILTLTDMPQLIACLAPRPVLVVNPVDGRRRKLSGEEMNSRSRFARSVYERYQSANHFQHVGATAPAAWIQKWVTTED
jgi:cephalosporin-C deacetylase-like acetyl esterase